MFARDSEQTFEPTARAFRFKVVLVCVCCVFGPRNVVL